MATIHQLSGSAKAKSKIEISTKCGKVFDRKGSDPFPGNVSGWNADVTCSECQA